MYKILNFLFRFLPSHWVAVGDHCPVSDAYLMECMKKNVPVEPYGTYYVKLGNAFVWVCNYPYSYGGVSTSRSGNDTRAGAYVAWKFRRYVTRQRTEQLLKELRN